MTCLEKVSKSEFAGKYHQPKGHIPAALKTDEWNNSWKINITEAALLTTKKVKHVFCKIISACTCSFYTVLIDKEVEQLSSK